MNMWWDSASEVVRANLEAQHVVSLRLMKIARGGRAAEQETRRMISEKFDASAEAALMLASGGTPIRVVKRYRSLIRANAKRLCRRRH